MVSEVARPLDPHAADLAQVQRREDPADLRLVGLQLRPGPVAEVPVRKLPHRSRRPADRVRSIDAQRGLADAHHEQEPGTEVQRPVYGRRVWRVPPGVLRDILVEAGSLFILLDLGRDLDHFGMG